MSSEPPTPSSASASASASGSSFSNSLTKALKANYASPQLLKAAPSAVNPDMPKYIIGVCAMDTKARSKPMRNILNRLLATGEFDIVVFGDKVILDEGIEDWPTCDFLISFFSKGFPLEKAIQYVKLRHPICVNDLPMQQLLMDRRLVLQVLDAIGVPTPRRLITHSNDPPPLSPEVEENLKKLYNIDTKTMFDNCRAEQVDPDHIRVKGDTMRKPFVEKPVSGENHNINIYFPMDRGGGVRRLFRKVANKSSEFVPDANDIRNDGSYIYEEFMEVDNAEDVKVYTIGENYAHAETRKSPVIDGLVVRNAEGKEVRYVTELLEEEQEIARRVCRAFGQFVCGFDLLRVNGRSYVIDVNGWSFVKGNDDYYDHCASIIRDFVLEVAQQKSSRLPTRALRFRENSIEANWKLKGFFSVCRHADRTPKQKVKWSLTGPHFMALLNGGEEEVVYKSQKLQAVADACDKALSDKSENSSTILQLRNLLMDKKGTFSNIKVQVKPSFNKNGTERFVEKVQVVVKWGGEFTHAGRHHSRDFGENLRKDLLIINKSLLDDVKIYSSTESRVTATAEIFAKAFLNEQEIDPEIIIVSKEMLDDSNAAKQKIEKVKTRLQSILNPAVQTELPTEMRVPKPILDAGGPEHYVEKVIEILKIMRQALHQNLPMLTETPHRYEPISRLSSSSSTSSSPAPSSSSSPLNEFCGSEGIELFRERWEKLFQNFCDVERPLFDPSKVSELYDSVKYDLLHNREFCHSVFSLDQEHKDHPLKNLYVHSKVLFDFIGPHEYGIEVEEKFEIAMLNSLALLRQIVDDLSATTISSKPCTRMYFTKESKVICLLNIVLLCGMPSVISRNDVDELDYLTQITFELYERNRGLATDSESREYSLRVGFSPGAHDPNLVDAQIDHKHSISVAPRKWITDHISLEDALSYLTPKIEIFKSQTSLV